MEINDKFQKSSSEELIDFLDEYNFNKYDIPIVKPYLYVLINSKNNLMVSSIIDLIGFLKIYDDKTIKLVISLFASSHYIIQLSIIDYIIRIDLSNINVSEVKEELIKWSYLRTRIIVKCQIYLTLLSFEQDTSNTEILFFNNLKKSRDYCLFIRMLNTLNNNKNKFKKNYKMLLNKVIEIGIKKNLGDAFETKAHYLK